MKIELSPELEAEIKTHRDRLAPLVETLRKSSGDLESLQESAGRLQTEIEELERTVDPNDSKTVQAMETRKAQFEIFNQRIERIYQRLGPHAHAVRDELRHTQNLVFQTCRSSLEFHIEAIAKAVLPFCQSQDRALQLARQTDFVRSYGAFLGRSFGGALDALAEGKLAIGFLETLLSGEEIFRFKK